MFDRLLESSHRDDSNKWSNRGSGDEITQEVLIEVNFTYLICSSVYETFIYQHLGINEIYHSELTVISNSLLTKRPLWEEQEMTNLRM